MSIVITFMSVGFLIKLVDGSSKNGILIYTATNNTLGMVLTITHTSHSWHIENGTYQSGTVNTSGMVHSLSPVMSVLLIMILLIWTLLTSQLTLQVHSYNTAAIDFNSGNTTVYKYIITKLQHVITINSVYLFLFFWPLANLANLDDMPLDCEKEKIHNQDAA